MAILHQARLTPSKLDAIRGWLPGRPFFDGSDPAALDIVGAYRFDDPDGEVGIETHLVRTAAGHVVQAPLTYRAAALVDAEDALVTTMEHSVLGRRWVYDGCADPVAVRAFLTTALMGGRQADLDVATADGPVRREPTTLVRGTGGPGNGIPRVDHVETIDGPTSTTVTAAGLRLILARVLDLTARTDGPSLYGRWPGQPDEVLLATVDAP